MGEDPTPQEVASVLCADLRRAVRSAPFRAAGFGVRGAKLVPWTQSNAHRSGGRPALFIREPGGRYLLTEFGERVRLHLAPVDAAG